jgi:protein-L-isoaspartate(D-aspartate) O-methyltransferase
MRRIPELVEWGTNNIRKDSPQLLEKRVVEIRNVDGWEGVEDEAPFDAIHVGAAAATLPQPLVDQLRVRATTFFGYNVTDIHFYSHSDWFG